MHIGVSLRDLMERDHLEDIDVNGKKISKWDLKQYDGEAWTGLLWLRIREVCGRL